MSTEGAVDSIQLITRKPLEQVRSVAVTPESATSVVLTRVLLGEVELVPLDQPADARMLIGDAALRSAFEDPTPALRPRPAVAGAHRPADGVRGVGLPRRRRATGCEELERAHLRSLALSPAPSPRRWPAAPPASTAGRPGSWPATSRSCATTSARASGRASSASSSWRTWPASWTRCRSCGSSSSSGWHERGRTCTRGVGEVLDRALAGERITDDDAGRLLRSRELVADRARRPRAAQPPDSDPTGSRS